MVGVAQEPHRTDTDHLYLNICRYEMVVQEPYHTDHTDNMDHTYHTDHTDHIDHTDHDLDPIFAVMRCCARAASYRSLHRSRSRSSRSYICLY